MKITLSEQGGWAVDAPPRQNVVDFALIDDESAHQGRSLADSLLNRSAAKRDDSHDRDAAEFIVTIEQAGKTTVVSASSTALSQEFAELLDWLKRQTPRQP